MKTETERVRRVVAMQAKARERNRSAGIPDMEVGDRHEPCEWFSEIGFAAILDRLGRAAPDADWSEEGGTYEDREAFLGARRLDHQRVANWLREAVVTPIRHRNGVIMGDVRIMWPDRVPRLKTWAGRQSLVQIIRQRQQALPDEVPDVLACEAAISGASGIDRGSATTSLEDGFSVDAVGMKRVTRIGMELLAIVGLETLPITVHPDGRSLSYEAAGSRWIFAVEARNKYFSRWGRAERLVVETDD